MRRTTFLALLIAVASCVIGIAPAMAQGKFSPELQVGTSIITRHQIDQRATFLALLGAPGDIRALAREQLINETLQLKAASDAGIVVPPEAIQAGISEFAGRANLTGEEFLTIVEARGISQATVRDFFTAGVAWRETVRSRFGDDIRATVDEDDVRRALAFSGTEGGVRVLISEIRLPIGTPETENASRLRAQELSQLQTEAEFSAAARQFSIAPSFNAGGELDWLALEALPDGVRDVIDALSPGQISAPVELPAGIGLYLLRDRQVVAAGASDALSIDYALFVVAGGAAEATRVANQIDVCDDLYGIAKGLPEERLIRESKPSGELASDIRTALAGMDEGEVSTAVTRGGNATVLMLCQRQPANMNNVDLSIAGNRILNARLGTAAAHYLAQLRAAARVTEFGTN